MQDYFVYWGCVYCFLHLPAAVIQTIPVRTKSSESVDSVFFYEYDSNGNVIKEMTDYNNDGEFESVTVTNYIYDDCGYMTEAHMDAADDGIIDKSGYYTWE